jgi:hypothetical protein
MEAWLHSLGNGSADALIQRAAATASHGLGFGDATTSNWFEKAVRWTAATGAVRHGADCFNYMFAGELDDSYLVTWDGFAGGVKFRYMGPAEVCGSLSSTHSHPTAVAPSKRSCHVM